MDLFEKYLLKENDYSLIKRALTDKSFKNSAYYVGSEDRTLINTDLATYGDAVIKLCLLEVFLDKEENLTKKKEKYETDEYLVTVVAEHYRLIKYIHKDEEDENLPNNYDYLNNQSKNHNKCKYIATAVEAMIGAIYKITKDLDSIVELIKTWTYF